MHIRKDILSSKAFFVFSVVALAAAVTQNTPGLQFDPLHLWVKILNPLLIFIGLAGSLYNSRVLRILGWLGIALYLGCAVEMIFPGEDYVSGGPNGPPLMAPHLVSAENIALRFVLFMTLIIVLVCSYIKIGKPPNRAGEIR
jgi:hypothetical protein